MDCVVQVLALMIAGDVHAQTFCTLWYSRIDDRHDIYAFHVALSRHFERQGLAFQQDWNNGRLAVAHVVKRTELGAVEKAPAAQGVGREEIAELLAAKAEGGFLTDRAEGAVLRGKAAERLLAESGTGESAALKMNPRALYRR